MAANRGFANPRYHVSESNLEAPRPAAPAMYYPPQVFIPVNKPQRNLPFWLQTLSALLGRSQVNLVHFVGCIALVIAIVIVSGRAKVSPDEGQCGDLGYAKGSIFEFRPQSSFLPRHPTIF